jgi:hypothetical protein
MGIIGLGSGNAVEELEIGLGNRKEVGELGIRLRSGTGCKGMGLRHGNRFGESGHHEVGEWEWGCGFEMELNKWIRVVEYIGVELGSGNRAVEWELQGWVVGIGFGSGNRAGEW